MDTEKDTVHECDRQTDRITITNTVQRRASHGKNRPVFDEVMPGVLSFSIHGV